MSRTFTPDRTALAVALALAAMAGAHAQTAPDAPAAVASEPAATPPAADTRGDGLKLDQVIVTGTSKARTKLNTSLAVSTMDAEDVKKSGATSAAEVLRSVPGVRSESSGGESNANMTVRGLPLSAGGSRYLQLQEDGLPLLQIGDLNFVTPDSYLRVDNTLDRVEAVRGGTSATLATNAPGGIVNFISRTGQDPGGMGSLTLGSGNLYRYELGYGGKLAERTTFYVGGHYRTGEGVRDGGVPVEEGGQIKGNVTQKLDNGYVRVYFKALDDRTPTYLPLPITVDAGLKASAAPGYDLRHSSLYSPYWIPDNTLTGANTRTTSNVNDGFKATSRAVGFETELEIGPGLKLQDRFRTAHNGGRFIGVFAPGGATPAAAAGTSYLTGPKAGQPYAGNTYTAVVFNTSIDDASLTANDLRVSKTIGDAASGAFTGTAGLYTSRQRVALTWNFNQYLLEATGDKPALLSSPGFTNGSPAFGNCCERIEDGTYTMTSPYALVTWEQGPLNVDASIRRDRQRAIGTFNDTNWNANPALRGLAYDLTRSQAMNYTVSHTSYSVGANYRVLPELSLFARFSDGASFNGNRISAGPGASNGNVVNNVDGSKPIPVNVTRQLEFGSKSRFMGVSTAATVFIADTDESNIDITKQPAALVATKYRAKGVELEAAYRWGGLRVTGAATYTDAKIRESSNPALVGSRPVRQAKLIYQLTPSYEVGDFAGGLNIVGTTRAMENSVVVGGFTAINAFASYRLSERASLSLLVNNLTDVVGITESGGGNARAINGRSWRATVAYEF